MKKIPLFYNLFLGLLAITIIGGFTYTKTVKPKIGYVIIQDLFNGFELKKELQKKLDAVKSSRLKIADSLKLELTVLSHKLQLGKATPAEKELFDEKLTGYRKKTEQFEEENQLLTRQYDAQIITQLNQYVSDFGKQNKYDMIYGNNDSGSLMYGREEYNITGGVKEFINNKYKGVN